MTTIAPKDPDSTDRTRLAVAAGLAAKQIELAEDLAKSAKIEKTPENVLAIAHIIATNFEAHTLRQKLTR